VRELKGLLVRDERQMRGMARQLTVFATGAPAWFSDREEIERILDAARRSVRRAQLVHAIVQSDLFRNK